MRLLSAAALAISATIASAQTPIVPPAGSPPGTLPPSATAPVVPIQPPQPALPAVRPAGNAATVNAQVIPEVAVYRALRQFPVSEHAVARKEILKHPRSERCEERLWMK